MVVRNISPRTGSFLNFALFFSSARALACLWETGWVSWVRHRLLRGVGPFWITEGWLFLLTPLFSGALWDMGGMGLRLGRPGLPMGARLVLRAGAGKKGGGPNLAVVWGPFMAYRGLLGPGFLLGLRCGIAFVKFHRRATHLFPLPVHPFPPFSFARSGLLFGNGE